MKTNLHLILLQHYLSDVTLNFPKNSEQIASAVGKILSQEIPLSVVQDLLQKFAAQQLIR